VKHQKEKKENKIIKKDMGSEHHENKLVKHEEKAKAPVVPIKENAHKTRSEEKREKK